MDPQLLGNLGHALVMGRPLPPADISPLLLRSLRLDTLAVTTHRSVPPGEPRLLLKTNAASHLAIGKHLEEADQHACLVANGQANAKELFLRTKPEIAMACQRSWDRLFMAYGFLPVSPFAGKRVWIRPTTIDQVNRVMVDFVLYMF